MTHDVHTQYLFVGYSEEPDEERWNKEYYENYCEFGDYICDAGNNLAQWVEGSYITAGDGIRQRIVEKR